MAGKPVIQCVGPSYMLPDRKTAVQRAINLAMFQVEGLGEQRQVVLNSTDGLAQVMDLGAPIRGAFTTESRRFYVAGTILYETTSGSPVSRGSIEGTGYVSMIDGTSQLVIAAGSKGYFLDLSTNVLTEITGDGWRGSSIVVELNGTFVFVALDQPDQFYLSAIDDASKEDGLDFSSADAQPDSIVTLRTLKQELVIFGTLSTEFWVYDGDADFPLIRFNSTPVDIGCVGPRAAVNTTDSVAFIGRTKDGTGIVYMFVGHRAQRISDAAVETALQDPAVTLSQAVMWVQQRKSAEYVCINAPGMPTSWCYDVATQQWHERAELVAGQWAPFRVDMVTALNGGHEATAGSVVYRMATDVYAIGSDPLVRCRVWPHLASPSMEPVTIRGVELACTKGYGGQVMLRVSKDGGFTWGAWLNRSLGATGRWLQRVRWLWLGAGMDTILELRCSDPVPFNIQGAVIDA